MVKKAGKTEERPTLQRVTTGITGLDKLLEGGLVKGSTVLLAGGPGTGKTIFCAQFLMEGLKRGEKCLYITLEESPEDIIDDCMRFGWDLSKYLANCQLKIEFKDPLEMVDVKREFLDNLCRLKMDRVVIDSTSVMGLYFKNPSDIRKNLYQTLQAIKRSGATTVVTAEAPEEGKTITRFGVEEYVTDGVITMHFVGFGGASYHSLQIRKMRRTDHGKDIYPMFINRNGIEIKKLE
ncbi:MAG: ATPase domain-containing protein [Candidatus Aenigmatarchaeota archaeon]